MGVNFVDEISHPPRKFRETFAKFRLAKNYTRFRYRYRHCVCLGSCPAAPLPRRDCRIAQTYTFTHRLGEATGLRSDTRATLADCRSGERSPTLPLVCRYATHPLTEGSQGCAGRSQQRIPDLDSKILRAMRQYSAIFAGGGRRFRPADPPNFAKFRALRAPGKFRRKISETLT